MIKNILSSLTTSEKNRILEMHRRAKSRFYLFENTLPTDIKWQSCDGNLNTLSPESISFLTPSGEENGKKLYKFTKTPEDKEQYSTEFRAAMKQARKDYRKDKKEAYKFIAKNIDKWWD